MYIRAEKHGGDAQTAVGKVARGAASKSARSCAGMYICAYKYVYIFTYTYKKHIKKMNTFELMYLLDHAQGHCSHVTEYIAAIEALDRDSGTYGN